MAELLAVDGLIAGYGESVVLENISFSIPHDGSLALLGRNGVGKTTLLRTLMGLTRVQSGAIRWRGQELGRTKTYRRAWAGLGWVPQERGMWPTLSVEEHLTSVARPGAWTLERVYENLPRLFERRANLGNQLSGGEQQMVAIGRALVLNPALLLLDEPMEGLAPIIVQELARIIGKLVGEGSMAIIIVEQHAKLALSMASQALVLDRGRIVHRSDSASLLADASLLQRLVSVA